MKYISIFRHNIIDGWRFFFFFLPVFNTKSINIYITYIILKSMLFKQIWWNEWRGLDGHISYKYKHWTRKTKIISWTLNKPALLNFVTSSFTRCINSNYIKNSLHFCYDLSETARNMVESYMLTMFHFSYDLLEQHEILWEYFNDVLF